MARPRKLGLLYFPLDVDIFEDDKFFDLQDKYGPLGEAIYLRLLCLTYKNGYYFEFGSIEKLTNMIVKSIGNKWVRDKKVVSDVIPFLAKINLFSSELMRENVLTSRSIQRRYQKVTGRRQPNTKKYWLLEENESQEALISATKNEVSAYNNPVSVYNNPVNVDNNDTKQNKTKEKESKVVVSLICRSGARQDIDSDTLQQLQQTYKHINVLNSLNKMACFLEDHPEKRRDEYTSYVNMWLLRDNEKAKEDAKVNLNCQPSYDIAEYESHSMFDDE